MKLIRLLLERMAEETLGPQFGADAAVLTERFVSSENLAILPTADVSALLRGSLIS